MLKLRFRLDKRGNGCKAVAIFELGAFGALSSRRRPNSDAVSNPRNHSCPVQQRRPPATDERSERSERSVRRVQTTVQINQIATASVFVGACECLCVCVSERASLANFYGYRHIYSSARSRVRAFEHQHQRPTSNGRNGRNRTKSKTKNRSRTQIVIEAIR